MAKINLRGLLAILLLLFFAASIAPVHSYPTTLSNTTQTLSKRTPNPKVPTAEEAVKHLKKLGPGKQVFYRGTVQLAASEYAKKIGGGFLEDASNGDGWATLKGGPFHERVMRMVDDKPTWDDEEVTEAVQAVSDAFALNSEGDVIVVLPYNIPNEHSHWDGEFEVLKENPKVDKVLAFDMKDSTVEPKGSPRELWPRPQPKTEHAG